jgi:hypothetical protein
MKVITVLSRSLLYLSYTTVEVIGKCYIYLAVLLALQVIPTDLFASIVSPVVLFLW